MMFMGEMDDTSDPLTPKLPSTAQGMRVLLVDRDTTSLMFMASILEAYSYKVTTMEIFSIAMAIYAARKGEFDVIIANVELNNMSDLEIVQDIVKNKKTPLIVMSNVDVLTLRTEARLDGTIHFLEKPLWGCELRAVWQHVFRARIGKAPRTRPYGIGGPVAEADPLLTMTAAEADQNQGGGGDRKRAHHGGGDDHHEEDNKNGGKRRCERIINLPPPPPPPSYEAPGTIIEKKQQVSSGRKQGSRWSKGMQFKLTAAISKLGDENANPKAIQELMKVPHLTERQIAHQLERYKAQVQLIMDACKDSPLWVPPPRINAPRAADATGNITPVIPQMQKQHTVVPMGQPPPVLNLGKTPDNGIRPGYSGRGRRPGPRERPPLPSSTTPFNTTVPEGKGKQIMGFQGNYSAAAPAPLQHNWQNPTPTPPTFTRLPKDVAGASRTPDMPLQHNWQNPTPTPTPPPPPPPPTFTRFPEDVAGASGTPDMAGDLLLGNIGFDDNDLAFLTDWLSRSLKADDGAGSPPKFDQMDRNIGM